MEKVQRMVDVISNGLGSQSMTLLVLSAEGVLNSKLSISGDTGWEVDRLRSDGKRQTAKQYFDEILKPYAEAHGIEAVFQRSKKKDGSERESLWEQTKWAIENKNWGALLIPVYGSRGGQKIQRCTERYKLKALRQTVRGRGYKKARFLQGIVIEESVRRVKGPQIESWDEFRVFKTIERYDKVEVDGVITKVPRFLQWSFSAYPLVDLKLTRQACQQTLVERGIPYFESTECDGCPHQDFERWIRTSPETLQELAFWEAKMDGQFFFTPQRIPLLEAIPLMDKTAKSSFGCTSGALCDV